MARGDFFGGGFKIFSAFWRFFLRFLRNFFGFVFVNGVLEPGVQVKMVGLAQFFCAAHFARERSMRRLKNGNFWGVGLKKPTLVRST